MKTILVVEDDVPLADILKIELESEGFEVHTENLGTPALTYAASHPINLVILDLKLPDINGYEVCKGLRKVCHPWTLPIIMLTGMTEPIDQLKGFAHGADAYLMKPCKLDDLLNTIKLLVA